MFNITAHGSFGSNAMFTPIPKAYWFALGVKRPGDLCCGLDRGM